MHGSARSGHHFIKGSKNKHVYVNIIQEHLKASAKNMRFYHDNDTKHFSHMICEWCLYNPPELTKTSPQSPHLNVIKTLWAKLETEIIQFQIKKV
jgi:predicted DsbA family dithiol-disulfide isomerase